MHKFLIAQQNLLLTIEGNKVIETQPLAKEIKTGKCSK